MCVDVFCQVCGIGKVSEKMLNALGISSCSHLGQQMALLSLLFSETSWQHFLQVSLGLGSTFIPRYCLFVENNDDLETVEFKMRK